MSCNQRVLEIDGALNFRDLGGYQSNDGKSVRWKTMFRSAQLNQLSASGIQSLLPLDIKTVIDLRFTDEIHQFPTVLEAIPNAEIITWADHSESDLDDRSNKMKRSWSDSLKTNDPNNVKETMRLNYPQKLYTHRMIYRTMLLKLSEGCTPLLFHCAAGKDRTGVAAALVLSLLGVSEDQIIDDYLLTQSELENRVEQWLSGGATDSDNYQSFQTKLKQQPKDLLKPIFDADVTYIKTLLDYVENKHNGFESYARNTLKLDQSVIGQLRENLLV